MKDQELYGSLVLVRPDLEQDPNGLQGKIGILTYIDNQENVYLKFMEGWEASYSPEDVLMLKKREDLFEGLGDDRVSISLEDYKDLYKISVLQDLGRGENLWEALEIAAKNPNIWRSSLVTVDQNMEHRHALVHSR